MYASLLVWMRRIETSGPCDLRGVALGAALALSRAGAALGAALAGALQELLSIEYFNTVRI